VAQAVQACYVARQRSSRNAGHGGVGHTRRLYQDPV